MEDPASAAAPTRARFVLWLHGLGDNGRANEPVAGYAFAGARWAFPTAPTAPVTCNQIREGRGRRAQGRGEHSRDDRPGDIRRDEPGGRVRLRAQPGRGAEHRERAAVPEDAGRLRRLQRLPPLRPLLCVQSHGRGQEDSRAVDSWASGFPGPDRGGARRDQISAGTRHELPVQGVRRAWARAGPLRTAVLRAMGCREWFDRASSEERRELLDSENEVFLLRLQLRHKVASTLRLRKAG